GGGAGGPGRQASRRSPPSRLPLRPHGPGLRGRGAGPGCAAGHPSGRAPPACPRSGGRLCPRCGGGGAGCAGGRAGGRPSSAPPPPRPPLQRPRRRRRGAGTIPEHAALVSSLTSGPSEGPRGRGVTTPQTALLGRWVGRPDEFLLVGSIGRFPVQRLHDLLTRANDEAWDILLGKEDVFFTQTAAFPSNDSTLAEDCWDAMAWERQANGLKEACEFASLRGSDPLRLHRNACRLFAARMATAWLSNLGDGDAPEQLAEWLSRLAGCPKGKQVITG